MTENNEIAIDFEIEEFYLGFKTSMINFYRNHSFKRPIKEWSITLNQLQKQKMDLITLQQQKMEETLDFSPHFKWFIRLKKLPTIVN